jgi:formamidopyrimidine-DNA glycosylase
MPELPEVEVTRLGIAPVISGRTISSVTVREPRLRWPVPHIVGQLTGRRVEKVTRRAKYLIIDCGDGDLIVHLGMSGSLRIVPADTAPRRHDHIDIRFGEVLLRLHDPRRFGAMLWAPRGEIHPLLAHLGVEPLSDELTGARLHALARGHRVAIKQFLMNGRHIVGIGNIYANESLFLAGISPFTLAMRVSAARCTRLTTAIRTTLTAAIHAGGSTLRDFVGGDGKPGYFQQTYRVYDRLGKPCGTCGTPIRRRVQGQRATFYCSTCQR